MKREQEKYIEGVGCGINLVFVAISQKIDKENQSAVSEEIRIKDCSTCAHKGERNGACRTCVTSHNSVTQKNSTPSHWEAKGD
jgi:hypothetical protein